MRLPRKTQATRTPRAPAAGVFFATSAQSRFFFTDIFGVFFGSATVALFFTD